MTTNTEFSILKELWCLAREGKPEDFLRVAEDIKDARIARKRPASTRASDLITKKTCFEDERKFEVEEIEVPWINESQSEAVENHEMPIKPEKKPETFQELLGYLGLEDDWYAGKLRRTINQPDHLRRNVGHLAAYAGNMEILKLLLEPLKDGKPILDVHAIGQGGWKPIHFAASKGHLDCVDLLLKNGSKLNSATSRGQKTPLKLAIDGGHSELVSFLKAKGGRIREQAAEFDETWSQLQAIKGDG